MQSASVGGPAFSRKPTDREEVRNMRVVMTLVVLAAAMSGAAGLLGWLDTASRMPENGLSAEKIAQSARSAVGEEIPLARGAWRNVVLVTEPEASGVGTLLSSSARLDCHFQVDERGQTRRIPNWTFQVRPSEAPFTIKVALGRRGADSPIPSAQWLGVQTLVALLSEKLSVPPGELLAPHPRG
jgi:hypothetical protein